MKIIPAGTIKRIHVDRRIMAQNRKHGTDLPAYTIQTSRGPIKAHLVEVVGQLVFDQSKKQLSCGARMYGETTSEVRYR